MIISRSYELTCRLHLLYK